MNYICIILLLIFLVPEEGIHRVARALHADQGFFVRVILLDALLEEAVEYVS